MAVPRPMAGTMGGVPASNFAGRSPGSKPVQRNAADHAAAAQKRRHPLQQLPLAVEHAHARGPEHLVPAENEEIGVECLHVGLLVRHALGPIDQHQRPGLVGAADDLGHGIDRAQHVGNGRHGHELRPLGEQLVEPIEPQQAVVGHRDMPQHGPGPLGKLLPGDEVRVVLHLGEQDFVARADVGCRPSFAPPG